MVEVRNNGVPLIEQAPRAGVTQAIVSLAGALSNNDQDKEKDSKETEDAQNAGKKTSGWLGFLSGRGKGAK